MGCVELDFGVFDGDLEGRDIDHHSQWMKEYADMATVQSMIVLVIVVRFARAAESVEVVKVVLGTVLDMVWENMLGWQVRHNLVMHVCSVRHVVDDCSPGMLAAEVLVSA